MAVVVEDAVVTGISRSGRGRASNTKNQTVERTAGLGEVVDLR